MIKYDEKYWNRLRKVIRKSNKHKPCWDCKNLRGFYFDNYTLDCKVEGDNWCWDFVGETCKHFKEK